MTLMNVLLIILILLACGLIGYLFVTLKKLNRSIDVLSADVHQLIENSLPILDKLDKASEKVYNITDDAESHMKEFNSFVGRTKDKLVILSSKVKEGKTKNPAINLVHNLNALSKGISAFWNKYQK